MDFMDLIIARRIVLDAVRIVLEMRNTNLDPSCLRTLTILSWRSGLSLMSTVVASDRLLSRGSMRRGMR